MTAREIETHSLSDSLTGDDIRKFQDIWNALSVDSIDFYMASRYGHDLLRLYKFVYRVMDRVEYERTLQLKEK